MPQGTIAGSNKKMCATTNTTQACNTQLRHATHKMWDTIHHTTVLPALQTALRDSGKQVLINAINKWFCKYLIR
jgi:hypothetical protein